MRRARFFIPALILFLLPAAAAGKPIVFPDFPWGSYSAEVESAAGGKGWKLVDKTFAPDRRELAYRTVFWERDCRLTFFFTPAGGKLFSARAEWEGTGFGYALRERITKAYGEPREKMDRIETYIWSRQNTELELRHGGDSTVLIYSDLNLWTDYVEETKRARARLQERDGD